MGYTNSFVLWVVIIFSLACLFNEVYADDFRINCGSDVNTTFGDRFFMGDKYSTQYLATPTSILANTAATTNLQLYQSARIFVGPTTYKLPINHMGRYIIRLYFHPFNYKAYNLSNSKFLISSQQYVLLHNYTPTSETMKEYSITVHLKFLEIIIEPAANFVAFLSSLEVFLAPSVLVQDDAILINPREAYKGIPTMALESFYRINMGGPTIIDKLWRTWTSDVNYVEHNNFSAKARNSTTIKYSRWSEYSSEATRNVTPPTIYETCRRLNTQNYPNGNVNVTWNFNIDIGFQYLVRFHYCDIVSESTDELYFNVFVDPWIVSEMLDLTNLGGGFLHTPIFLDFVTPIINSNKLKVSIAPPRAHMSNPNAILNGLEIMKMNDIEFTLDKDDDNLPSFKNGTKGQVGAGITSHIIVFVVVVICFLALVAMLYVFCMKSDTITQGPSIIHESTRDQDFSNNATTTNEITSDVGHRIPLGTIMVACNNFDENFVIGMGSFAKVYKGILEDGTIVAIKRGHVGSEQSLIAFQTEVELLSQFRHRHLVSLIGYCEQNNENILIYEYMENGTLKSHLYGSGCSFLNWKQRLKICIGAAKGLQYLHSGSTTLVIHRDVKSSNILLDENFNAKVADFGLSKARDNLHQEYLPTDVKGTFGYLDPEYARTRMITNKSDVYSFGALLFEVLCARVVVDSTLPVEEANLMVRALNCKKEGKLEEIIDPCLQGNIKPESFRIYWEIAEKCIADTSVERPSMNDVLCNLEHALRIEEDAINPNNDPQQGSENNPGEPSTSSHYTTIIDDDDDLQHDSWNKVFSDILRTCNQ